MLANRGFKVDKIQQSVNIMDTITSSIDKQRAKQEEIKQAKKRAKEALLIVKKWIITDLDDSDPEQIIHDIQYLLEGL